LSRVKSRRKNYFIKKKFQTNFSVYFAALVVLEIILIGILLFYVSRGTFTTAYSPEGIQIKPTAIYFFINFLIISLIVAAAVCLSALVVFIFLSHRLAGPLYRFEKSLEDITNGRLNMRVKIRRTDQLEELKSSLNTFLDIMDDRIGELQKDAESLISLLEKGGANEADVKRAAAGIKKKLDYFTTTK
jgi:methyl-accepting chemotaxis protein